MNQSKPDTTAGGCPIYLMDADGRQSTELNQSMEDHTLN